MTPREKKKICQDRWRNLDKGLKGRWSNINSRCRGKKRTDYRYYGGKGIKVKWKTYQEFKNDMFRSYLRHLNKFGTYETTLDRIDSKKDYCKENCRWATWEEQKKNQHSKKL